MHADCEAKPRRQTILELAQNARELHQEGAHGSYLLPFGDVTGGSSACALGDASTFLHEARMRAG